jgi:hypothetical protein
MRHRVRRAIYWIHDLSVSVPGVLAVEIEKKWSCPGMPSFLANWSLGLTLAEHFHGTGGTRLFGLSSVPSDLLILSEIIVS